jgi:hypothetical protein
MMQGVCFEEDETKTGVPLEFPWPEILRPPLEDWLARWRPETSNNR